MSRGGGEGSGLPPPGGPRFRFTMLPNEFTDQLLPCLRGAEVPVCLVLARKTYGWDRVADYVSLSQFAKAAHLNRATVWRVLTRLESRGIIEAVRGETDAGDPDITLWRFVYAERSTDEDPGDCPVQPPLVAGDNRP